MKRVISVLFPAFMFTCLFAFGFAEGSIKGKIVPPDGAKKAWIIDNNDSTAVDIVSGNFSAAVKAGVYRVVIEAVPPYKNSVVEIVNVSENQMTYIGEIELQRE